MVDDGRIVIIMLVGCRWNGLHLFEAVVDGIQFSLDASDGFHGCLSLRLRYSHCPTIIVHLCCICCNVVQLLEPWHADAELQMRYKNNQKTDNPQ